MTRKILSSCLFWLGVALLGWLLGFQLAYFSSVPDASEFHRPAGSAGISPEALADLQSEMPVTGSTAERGVVGTLAGKSAGGLVVYADRFYNTVYRPVMKYGGFWATEGAVISERLARELFLSADCLGALVTVGGRSYAITGVMRTAGGFLSGAVPGPDLLLPMGPQHTVERVAFPGGEPEAYYLSALERAGLRVLSSWTFVRLRPEANLLLVLDQWVLLFGWMGLLGWFISWMGRRCGRFAARLRVSAEHSYWKEVFLIHRPEALGLLAAVLGFVILSAAMLCVVSHPLTIPVDAAIPNVLSITDWTDFVTARLRRPLELASPVLGEALLRNGWAAAVTLIALLLAALALAGVAIARGRPKV